MIPIYIGSEPKTEIPKLVLQYSILKNTQKKVTFPGLDSDDNWKKQSESKFPSSVGTGFSLLRWDIPRRNNYDGFAIYLDADILCVSDIGDLFRCDVTYPNPECSHWCTWQKSKFFEYDTPETSVFLVDCQKARNNQQTLEEICADLRQPKYEKDRSQYIKHMRALTHRIPPQRISSTFNHLNTYKAGETRLIHYTKEPEQVWYNEPKNTQAKLWEDYFIEAYKEGYIKEETIREALKIFRKHTKTERGRGLHPYWKKVLKA